MDGASGNWGRPCVPAIVRMGKVLCKKRRRCCRWCTDTEQRSASVGSLRFVIDGGTSTRCKAASTSSPSRLMTRKQGAMTSTMSGCGSSNASGAMDLTSSADSVRLKSLPAPSAPTHLSMKVSVLTSAVRTRWSLLMTRPHFETTAEEVTSSHPRLAEVQPRASEALTGPKPSMAASPAASSSSKCTAQSKPDGVEVAFLSSHISKRIHCNSSEECLGVAAPAPAEACTMVTSCWTEP
mmetsp:Transcript_70858/g.169654  ORF Transcript_70858/g.169654 Transcript_70858/m.169654 type:complete len:238 (-) Transcript_70858:395-1108(-)